MDLREQILKTAVGQWDPEDGYFVVRSPLCEKAVGAAKTREAAFRLFLELVEDTLALQEHSDFL